MKFSVFKHLFLAIMILPFGISASVAQTDSVKQVPAVWNLENSIDYAITNNITVKQAVLDKDNSEINYNQAKNNWLPSLSGSASESLTRGTSIDPITSDFVSQQIYSTSLGLNASMTLYSGNKIRNQAKQYGLLLEQNELYVTESKNSIILEVTQAYLQALYYKEGIEIAENNLKASEEQYEQTEALFDAGTVAAKDLADIRSQYASDQYSLVAARNSYAQQILTLRQLLELDPEQEYEPDFPEIGDDIEVIIPDKITAYQNALGFLPEIKASQLSMSTAELDMNIAKAGYLPTLSLGAGLSTGYTSTQEYTFTDQLDNNFNQRVSLSLSIPIFSKFQNKSNVQSAKISMESANLDRIAAKKEVYRKIENAYQSAISAQGEMEAALVQMEAAQVSFELAQEQYEVGLLNTTDLLIDQNEYLTAQQKYVQTKYTKILYYQLLQFYQGEPIKL
ncbi:TolC family protein [Chondrinema litorale]|uniref:TolC family protein n=1 Tax=Chondrinema litorale TaxID=2994555 RepID=UPI0025430F2B|nr:TolC family protein [Chondrinema litorale]UZR98867.1 TolC family protein [Chondrinema litorale]